MAKASNGGGWAGATLNTIYTVFALAVIFGVFLIAVIQVGNVLQNTSGSNTTIGTTGQTPYQVFTTLVGYLVTLAQFVGIIVLLVIVGLLIYVLGTGVLSAMGVGGGGK